MSKITNGGLTRSGTGCFIAVLIWQQWGGGIKGLKQHARTGFHYIDKCTGWAAVLEPTI